ncbi:transmembrane protein, putative (macronuclear) [Tetrahymena thermophila SB210]|uniref:Transmembrane protein, putative n=1 Tax=Tetrahymena thermophila (strain SB210) TaxID=312017 RepID=I7M7V8_TETTS|nr:transmembrane protein, putative [Tetrahymena thermophila SB210]EAR96097.2 transmembrane protein, putative [Tetrahymena thermophila SB210]|eukprot:XP_001016342.2 transmembrane protein, putative [Tetrahymena thermophila SB210]
MDSSCFTEESKNELLDVIQDNNLPFQAQQPPQQPQRRVSNLLKETLKAEFSSSVKNVQPSFPFFERRGVQEDFFDSSDRISFGSDFNPFKYPGTIQEALIHEQANILGEKKIENKSKKREQSINDSQNSDRQQQDYQNIQDDIESQFCKCCGKMINNKKLTFFKFNYSCINKKYGGSLSYLFQVNKFFIATILAVILIYLIYFQIQTEKVCSNIKNKYKNQQEFSTQYSKQHDKQTQEQEFPECLTLFRLSIISEVQLRRYSDQDTQIYLADLKFIILLLLQVSNIFFYQSPQILKKMNKIKQETQLTKLRKQSLLIKYLPQLYTDEEIVKNLQLIVKNTYNLNVKIACITNIYNTYEKHKLVNQRMDLLQKIYSCTKQTKKQKLIEKLRFNYSQLKQLSDESSVFSGQIIITFLSEKDQIIVYNLLNKSYFLSTVHKLKQQLCDQSKEKTTRRIICEKAPELSEIIWQNIGYLGKQKGQLSVLLIAFTLIIFIGLPRLTQFLYEWQFNSKSRNETLSQKVTDYLISLILFVISNFVWIFMKYLLQKSKQPTLYIESIYMVVCNFAFHLQFYIIVPIFLTYFSINFKEDKVDYEKVNVKVYGIVTLISGFCGLSLLEIFLGPQYLLHRYRKWKIQRGKKQYFQQALNNLYQRPNFPLEKRVVILYKQYTFGIIISFICPIAWFYVLGGLIFHFIGNRFAIVYQYSMYSFYNYKIVTVATRIAAIAMMYVVTISYLLTEQIDGFFTRESYIQFAKYMLVFNVFINTIFENVYKAIKKRRKNIQTIQKKMMKREESFEVTDEGNENLYSYYNKYQEVQGKIHPSWSDEKVEEIIFNQNN